MSHFPVVIVGAGHAGFQAAASLRQDGLAGAIALVGDENSLPYQRPPLSKTFIKSDGDPASLLFRPARFFADNDITCIFGDGVAGIDRARSSVHLASGSELSYGHLILALGGVGRHLSVPGAVHADVAQLRTLEDAVSFRRKLADAKCLVVIGGGLIGLETAATARAMGLEVTVVEAGKRVMGRAVSPQISDFCTARHRENGIRILLQSAVVRIVTDKKGVTGVELADGETIACDLVLCGIGIEANVGLAEAAGLHVESGIVVDEMLLTSDPDISAIGDCAVFPASSGSLRLESVQNAVDQARCVAARLTGKSEPYGPLPLFWSNQGEIRLQMAGLAASSDDGAPTSAVIGDMEAGKFSVLSYRDGRLVCVESVNRPADHMAARKLMASNRDFPPACEIDSAFDLKHFVTVAGVR
jgi:3-phenylpropionate/trans-cinnamate dioxygenase ferredoxin reductase component